ncbi:MAG: hypothetical protein ACKVJP_01380, partial [Flavobacteriales bacterium]
NYELDSYVDALIGFPKSDVKLDTKKGRAFLQKTDIFKRMLWFSYFDEPAVFHPLSLERVNEIIAMNNDKVKPDDLKDFNLEPVSVEKVLDYENVVGQDDLERFDRNKNQHSRNKKKKRKPQRGNNPQNKQNTNGNKPQNNKNKQSGNKQQGKSRKPGENNLNKGQQNKQNPQNQNAKPKVSDPQKVDGNKPPSPKGGESS